MRGQPLTLYEREKIEFYIKGKVPAREMARYLHRDHSVIVRELERNKNRDGTYCSSTAHEKALQRRTKPRRKKLEEDDVLRNWMIQKMRIDGWSPMMIAEKLKNRPDQAWMMGKCVSHETIYQYIYEGDGRFMGLYQYLVRKHKKRQRRYARKSNKNKGILYMTPIKYRPEEINEKQTFGHLESDSVIYRKQSECLSVQYERSIQLVRFHRVANKSAEATHAAVVQTIESLHSELIKSVTYDRGTEGALHWKLRLDYGIDTFHCDPYCSWQKGGVENVNGIIRRYLPIETDLSQYSDGDLLAIQEKINNRPRKSLGWKTPNEAYREILNSSNTHQVVHC
jgi:IS30 family transposase